LLVAILLLGLIFVVPGIAEKEAKESKQAVFSKAREQSQSINKNRNNEPWIIPSIDSTCEYFTDYSSFEEEYGLEGGGDLAWGVRFTVDGTCNLIESIQVSFGVIGDSAVGDTARFYLYGDPNGDGHPEDAMLLASSWGFTANEGTNSLNSYAIGPAFVTDTFFVVVAIEHADGDAPIRFDTTTTDTTWLVSDFTDPADPFGSADFDTLSALAIPVKKVPSKNPKALANKYLVFWKKGDAGTDQSAEKPVKGREGAPYNSDISTHPGADPPEIKDTILANIAKEAIKFDCIPFIWVFGTCYSGGMIDELAKLGGLQFILAACRYDKGANRCIPAAKGGNETDFLRSYITGMGAGDKTALEMAVEAAKNDPFGPGEDPVPARKAEVKGSESPTYCSVKGEKITKFGLGSDLKLTRVVEGKREGRGIAVLWAGDPQIECRDTFVRLVDKLTAIGFKKEQIYLFYKTGRPGVGHPLRARIPMDNCKAATKDDLEAFFDKWFDASKNNPEQVFFFVGDHGNWNGPEDEACARVEPDPWGNDDNVEGSGSGDGEETPPPRPRTPDCNRNGIKDACDRAAGRLHDDNDNGVPDECERGVRKEWPREHHDQVSVVGNPKVITLYQNYPNPFNPVSRISLYIPEAMLIELAIYDARGNRVRTLAATECIAGHHSYLWDGADSHGNPVSSGVYFYRLQAGGKKLTKKMILLK
jgi:hypothetical protein